MKLKRVHKNMPVVALLSLGYFITVLIGSGLLLLPIASKTGSTPIVDAILTATSATCVTGLTAFDTAAHFTLFGQIVILCLIQIGGLGFMTVITLLFMMFKRNIGIYNRTVMMQSAGSYNISSIPTLIKRIIIGTLIFEGTGAAILAAALWKEYGTRAIYLGIFHSISAYCNAGFDVFGTGSLSRFASDPVVLFTIMFLVVIGGLGFLVWGDILDCKFKFSKYQLHTKIVLIATFCLILIPALLYFLFEFTDFGLKSNYAGMAFGDKIVNSLFLSVSPRTAGFYTVDLTKLSPSGQLLTDVLMLIGGNSGSTAGGVKVTTVVVVMATLFASARRQEHIVMFKRRVGYKIVNQAVSLIIAYLSIILIATLIIGFYEPFDVTQIVFEVISAIGTVGLSLGLTENAMIPTKIIITFLMYIGRLGALTLFDLLLKDKNNSIVQKPEGKVLVG
ncbi:MAG: Trk family potassium uptake protein [Ruminococcaceae bacterium]|nr:Trk family potassium uptake protein [Oscillospiraceae bacterium]